MNHCRFYRFIEIQILEFGYTLGRMFLGFGFYVWVLVVTTLSFEPVPFEPVPFLPFLWNTSCKVCNTLGSMFLGFGFYCLGFRGYNIAV